MISRIKYFLKPNLRKAALVIGFGALAYIFGVNWCAGMIYDNIGSFPEVCFARYTPIFWGPLFSLVGNDYYYDMAAGLSLGRLIFGAVYWYLIASAAVFVYDILKRKKIHPVK